MKDTTNKIFGGLCLVAGIVLFAGVLLASFFAVKSLHADYLAIRDHDLAQPADLELAYDDRIYASIGAGIGIVDGDTQEQVTAFLAESLRTVDNRILSCGILYAMMTAAVLAYPVFRKYGGNKRRHLLCAALAAPVLFAAFTAAILIFHAVFRLPFYAPAGAGLPMLALSLLCAAGGCCCLAWLLRKVRLKILAAVLAVPAVFALFLFGTSFEGQLYCPPTVDSFDFITEIDPHALDEDYDGEVWYDDEKNVIVLNGEEYPPRQAENPDRLRGAARLGACAFEAVSPYGGNGLFAVWEMSDAKPPVWIAALYAVKAAALAALPFCIGKKRDPEMEEKA